MRFGFEITGQRRFADGSQPMGGAKCKQIRDSDLSHFVYKNRAQECF